MSYVPCVYVILEEKKSEKKITFTNVIYVKLMK